MPDFRKRRIIVKPRAINASCPFCASGTSPDYKEYKEMLVYITDRGKIVGKDRSGFCSKHQRALTIAIKRGRNLALLSSSPSL